MGDCEGSRAVIHMLCADSYSYVHHGMHSDDMVSNNSIAGREDSRQQAPATNPRCHVKCTASEAEATRQRQKRTRVARASNFAELSGEPPLPKTSPIHPQTTHPWKTPFRLFSHAFCSYPRQTPHLDCFRRPSAGHPSPATDTRHSLDDSVHHPSTALLEDRHQRIHLRLSAPSTATR